MSVDKKAHTTPPYNVQQGSMKRVCLSATWTVVKRLELHLSRASCFTAFSKHFFSSRLQRNTLWKALSSLERKLMKRPSRSSPGSAGSLTAKHTNSATVLNERILLKT